MPYQNGYQNGGGQFDFHPVWEILRKTPFLKPYYFALFLVVCAIPLWITGLALDKDIEDQKSDEALLLAATAMHGLAYFILEIIGSFLLKEKWVGCTCCTIVCMYPLRCGACCTFICWLVPLTLLVSEDMGSKALFIPLILSFFGVFVTNVILLDQVGKIDQQAPGETNKPGQAPGKTNENEIPTESLGKPKNQQAPGETSEKVREASSEGDNLSKSENKPSDSVFLSKLKEMKIAKDAGLLSETEFESAKQQLLSTFTGVNRQTGAPVKASIPMQTLSYGVQNANIPALYIEKPIVI